MTRTVSLVLIAAQFIIPTSNGLLSRACYENRLNRGGALRQRSLPLKSSQEPSPTEKEESKKHRISKKVSFALHTSIAEISEESWNDCLVADGLSSPFTEHSWLRCLEESRCASPETGWVPQHISVQMDGNTIGHVPLYIKAHSMGEFIFDNSWAEAAYQAGINYYPKLLIGVPFTPATGHRILLTKSVWEQFSTEEITQLRKTVATFLKQVAASNKISSVHFNFLTEPEATDLSGTLLEPTNPENGSRTASHVREILSRLSLKDKDDYLRRTSIQYHWQNQNMKNECKPYQSFEEYLSCFKSKRRITIRRERKRVLEEEGIRIDAVVGEDILKYEGLVERMFEIYLSTIDKLIWGRQYLTKEFFVMLAESDFCKNLCFMCARYRSCGEELKADDVFAGTFNIVKDGVFFGRYWGCLPGKEVKNLHFEACYWAAIEFCIKNGMKRMEPGAGGGDYKWARGFDPALIHSAHYICHPGLRRAVSQFLDHETENNVELKEYLTKRSAVGAGVSVEGVPDDQ